MISDNAEFTTMDLEDFYLGTSLPFPEFIRIPAKFIPKKVIAFYKLKQFIQKGALYCAVLVLKTHYGLPQAVRGLVSRTTLRPPRAKRILPAVSHTLNLPQPQRDCQVLASCRRLRRRLVQQNGHEPLHQNPTTTL